MSTEAFLGSVRRQLPTLSAEHQAELARVIERLVAAFAPEQIYLFGSQARGDATANSDVDLLIVVAQSDLLPHQRDQAAYRAIGWHTFPLDVLVMTRPEFDRRCTAAASLASTVLREGRTLYAA